MYFAVKTLEDDLGRTSEIKDITELSMYYKDTVIPSMDAVRAPADELETLTSKKILAVPYLRRSAFRRKIKFPSAFGRRVYINFHIINDI